MEFYCFLLLSVETFKIFITKVLKDSMFRVYKHGSDLIEVVFSNRKTYYCKILWHYVLFFQDIVTWNMLLGWISKSYSLICSQYYVTSCISFSLVFKTASKKLVSYLINESYLKHNIFCLNNKPFCIPCYNAFQELEWTVMSGIILYIRSFRISRNRD